MSIDIFNLVKEKMAVFVHMRLEKHGEENVTAYDIKLSGDFSNSILLKLHADLRDTFYVADRQADVEGFKKQLRFPRIDNAMKWAQEIPRTLLTLHDAHDAGEDLVLANGHTDKFEFDMLEGGTVRLSCRVKLPELTDEQVLKLGRANGQTLPVSLECAPLEEKQDNFQQAELITQEPHSDARKELESLFKAPPTDMSIANGTDDTEDDPDFREVAGSGVHGNVDSSDAVPAGVGAVAAEPAAPAKKRGGKKVIAAVE